jgi:hypothetical protein
MSKALILCTLIFQCCGLYAQNLPVAQSADTPPSHAEWDSLLSNYVADNGLVDYAGFQKDRTRLEEYLISLGNHIPGKNWTRQEQLAYFINLYNAATVQLILEHFPVESIKDISRPWGREFIQVGGDRLSLGAVEHRILRKLGDPRIHFAINCASYSCPKLLPFAFTADALETQLELATRGFINDPERNSISPEKAAISRIFKWYRKDFTSNQTSLIDYINSYLTNPIPEDTPVSFLSYDWSLNKQIP